MSVPAPVRVELFDVHGKQNDDDDRDGEPGDDRGDELAGGFDRGSVWCFAHACLVSRGYVSGDSVTATAVLYSHGRL